MIRLAIIEDNAPYRKALQSFIVRASDIEVIHVAENLENIAEVVQLLQPDVMIMDIDLPGLSGIEGVQLVKKVIPGMNIIMLTVFEDEDKIFRSIKAGALGYLLKKDPPDKILEAVRSVHRGESVMNGQIARKILGFFSAPRLHTPDLEEYNLTKREKEILGLLMDGLSYKEIASRCFISIDTLYSHIRKVYSKLNVHSRSEIAARFR